MTLLSWLSRQIYEAGANNEHLKDAKKAAFESSKAAVRRLSIQCAQKPASSGASKTHQRSKKAKSGQVHPEMRYMYRLLSNHMQASLSRGVPKNSKKDFYLVIYLFIYLFIYLLKYL